MAAALAHIPPPGGLGSRNKAGQGLWVFKHAHRRDAHSHTLPTMPRRGKTNRVRSGAGFRPSLQLSQSSLFFLFSLVEGLDGTQNQSGSFAFIIWGALHHCLCSLSFITRVRGAPPPLASSFSPSCSPSNFTTASKEQVKW